MLTDFNSILSFCRAKSNKSHRFSLIEAIEFGNRTLRKVPVPLCSISEPIEQQSDWLGSIEFARFLVRFRSISCTGQILFKTRKSVTGSLLVWIFFATNRKSVHTGTHPMLTLVPEYVLALCWGTATALELPQMIPRTQTIPKMDCKWAPLSTVNDPLKSRGMDWSLSLHDEWCWVFE